MPYSLSDRVLLGLLAVEDRELRGCCPPLRGSNQTPSVPATRRLTIVAVVLFMQPRLVAIGSTTGSAGAAGFILSKWLGIPEGGSVRPSQTCPSNSEIQILTLTLRNPSEIHRRTPMPTICGV